MTTFNWRPWAALVLAVGLVFSHYCAYVVGGDEARLDQSKKDKIVADRLKADAAEQVIINNKAAGAHATELGIINQQLGDAREKIALLSGRRCLSSSTVRMLDTVGSGGKPGATPASEPSGAPAAPAADADDRFATERDVAGFIAICRSKYAEVASQLNQILDIEDKRWPP